MKIKTYYESGSIGVVDTTVLSRSNGFLFDDCYVNVQSILDGKGLAVDRMSFTDEDGANRVAVSNNNPILIVKPEELEGIKLITVDGEPFAYQMAPGEWHFMGIDVYTNVGKSLEQLAETEGEAESFETSGNMEEKTAPADEASQEIPDQDEYPDDQIPYPDDQEAWMDDDVF